MRTFGTIKRAGGKWAIEVEPHVVIRLKRLFPKVSRRAHGAIRIVDTVETCSGARSSAPAGGGRDVRWFGVWIEARSKVAQPGRCWAVEVGGRWIVALAVGRFELGDGTVGTAWEQVRDFGPGVEGERRALDHAARAEANRRRWERGRARD